MSAAPTLQSFIAGRWLGQHGAQALRSARISPKPWTLPAPVAWLR